MHNIFLSGNQKFLAIYGLSLCNDTEMGLLKGTLICYVRVNLSQDDAQPRVSESINFRLNNKKKFLLQLSSYKLSRNIL